MEITLNYFRFALNYSSSYYPECTNGTYGANCGSTCGQCRNDADCDPISGMCTFGCDPGWQGLRCQQSKSI